MKTLKWLWNFLKKNWRWFIPVLILVAFGLVPEKTFNEWLGFVAGIILMGFVWYAWDHLINNKKI